MKRCAQCGGKFGLIRHTFLRGQFCSKICLQAYKLDLDMKRSWLRAVLAGYITNPASNQREQPGSDEEAEADGPKVLS
jgi:hypothetical protein